MHNPSEAERKLFNPKSFSQIEAEMKERGFHFVGLESLTKFKFTKEAKFVAEPFRTKDEVLQEYQARFGEGFELELLEQEGLRENQQAVFVFAKKKE